MPVYANKVLEGDCLAVLRELPDNTFDAVVTDPPYGLGKEPTVEQLVAFLQGADLVTGDFMGARWDIPSVLVWREVYRVLKPGGHVLTFGGTRTWDLISLGARAAGFEFRDTIADVHPALMMVHGMGFPKSLNVSKAIDKAAGAEREVVGTYRVGGNALTPTSEKGGTYVTGAPNSPPGDLEITKPATPEAEKWDGWGTALKPSWEPVLVFRKPLEGTVIENVMAHGTGAMNIDGCRIGPNPGYSYDADRNGTTFHGQQGDRPKQSAEKRGTERVESTQGRWPPNMTFSHAPGCKRVGAKQVKSCNPGNKVNTPKFTGNAYAQDGWTKTQMVVPENPVGYADEDGLEEVEAWECVDGCPVKALDEQSGELESGSGNIKQATAAGYQGDAYGVESRPEGSVMISYGDKGGASRFFPQFEASKGEGRWPPNMTLSHAPGCKQVGTKEVPAPIINRFDDGMKPFGNGAGHPYTSSGGGTEQVPVWECVEGCPVKALDEQSGELISGGGIKHPVGTKNGFIEASPRNSLRQDEGPDYTVNRGGASRFTV